MKLLNDDRDKSFLLAKEVKGLPIKIQNNLLFTNNTKLCVNS